MAHYLVTATPKADRLSDLAARLARDEFLNMQPFGAALTRSLRAARQRLDGSAVWEEEDYCRRAAVLDHYFDRLQVEPVSRDTGWRRIEGLPHLFPEFAKN